MVMMRQIPSVWREGKFNDLLDEEIERQLSTGTPDPRIVATAEMLDWMSKREPVYLSADVDEKMRQIDEFILRGGGDSLYMRTAAGWVTTAFGRDFAASVLRVLAKMEVGP